MKDTQTDPSGDSKRALSIEPLKVIDSPCRTQLVSGQLSDSITNSHFLSSVHLRGPQAELCSLSAQRLPAAAFGRKPNAAGLLKTFALDSFGFETACLPTAM
jgi:hypothetical protein